MSVNKALLLGHLGADPEVRYTDGGQAVANFRMATSESWTDKAGNRQEKTEWHRIVVWGRTAENVGQYLKKGREVFVEGRIETREWTDKDGQKRWSTEIKADRVVFVGGGGGESRESREEAPREAGRGASGGGRAGGYTPPAGYAPPTDRPPAGPGAAPPNDHDDIPF
mgnify:CR=1 FL=1